MNCSTEMGGNRFYAKTKKDIASKASLKWGPNSCFFLVLTGNNARNQTEIKKGVFGNK
jgi:hypothetical protein